MGLLPVGATGGRPSHEAWAARVLACWAVPALTHGSSYFAAAFALCGDDGLVAGSMWQWNGEGSVGLGGR